MLARGGLVAAHIEKSPRQIYLLQRKASKVGDGLGKTTGWIHRTSLKNRNVEMVNNVSYRKVDDAGLHIEVDGDPQVLKVDNIVICAGQVSEDGLAAPLREAGFTVHVVGGAAEAGEPDATRAIRPGAEVAAALSLWVRSPSLLVDVSLGDGVERSRASFGVIAIEGIVVCRVGNGTTERRSHVRHAARPRPQPCRARR